MYKYYANCLSWPKNQVTKLVELIDKGAEVTRKTFVSHVDKDQLKEIEECLGYEEHHTKGMTMSQDPYVSYYRSKIGDEVVYYFSHSAIEYVFRDVTRQERTNGN